MMQTNQACISFVVSIIFVFFDLIWDRRFTTQKTQDVNWTYIRRSEDVLVVFWTSYVRSIYVLCLLGKSCYLPYYCDDFELVPIFCEYLVLQLMVHHDELVREAQNHLLTNSSGWLPFDVLEHFRDLMGQTS